jgi:hypothetical protein
MVFPPESVQFLTTIEVKVFPDETRMSKYSSVALKVGEATGLPENCETVMPPMPVAVTVVPSFVALAVPVCVDDDADEWLTAPLGADGGVVDGVGATA